MAQKKEKNTLLNYFQKANPAVTATSVDIPAVQVKTEIGKDKRNRTPSGLKYSLCDEPKQCAKRFKLDESAGPLEVKKVLFVKQLADLDTKKEDEVAEIIHEHAKLDFLKKENIKDSKGRKYNDPNYDGRTLYVPESYLSKLSPGFRQWWDLKCRYFDCILLFKVGKFYELYHMDADVAVNVLECTYMKGEMAHSGFPEISCAKMTSSLVKAGYKVGRVEQTESAEAMANRCKMQRASKFQKVVKRELCQITNRGTQIAGAQYDFQGDHKANYMLGISKASDQSKFGICLIETSFGEIIIGEFEDSNNFSRLRTLLAHFQPVLIIHDKSNISTDIMNMLNAESNRDTDIEVVPENVPIHPDQTLKKLKEKYFYDKELPEAFMSMVEYKQSQMIIKKRYEACFSALEICLWYLNYCLIDKCIMSIAIFKTYVAPDALQNDESIKSRNCNMVLDAVTLSNLRLINGKASLLNTLDRCCTKFGKRLLHSWICSPCSDITIIKDRQNAITEFTKRESGNIRFFLSTLPDYQRKIVQIQGFGAHNQRGNHPDNRAVLFEEKSYNNKKIQKFILLLRDLEELTKIPDIYSNYLESRLIKDLSQHPPKGNFPDIKPTLSFFQNAFDHKEAMEQGVIAPKSGVDPEFDLVIEKIKKLEADMQEYLTQQSAFFGCQIKYFGNDKKRFQLEIPDRCSSKTTSEYFFEGQNKGLRRYTTSQTKDFLKKMIKFEDEKAALLKGVANRIFQQFSNYYLLWKKSLDCVGELDCLLSLADFSSDQHICCIPELFINSGVASLDIQEAYYPLASFAGDFIPNSITIGSESDTLLLLTGPNMGGKSTLMRLTAIICILAHMGSHVPAKSCKMSLIDRIFTRLGAQDDILAGHSTFFVELSETTSVIQNATDKSLVLLDELGRGTATYDGSAVAAAVAIFLAKLGCRSIFSTHYHNLIHYFRQDPRVCLEHMACMVENEDDDDPTQEAVTFMYKLMPGACPKSFGFNAAKLAGMSSSITARAFKISKIYLETSLRRKLFLKVLSQKSVKAVRRVIKMIS